MNMIENDWLFKPLVFKQLDFHPARCQQKRLAGLCPRLILGMHTPVSGLHAGQSLLQARYSKSNVIHCCTFAAGGWGMLALLQEDENTRENQGYIRRKVITEFYAKGLESQCLFVSVLGVQMNMSPGDTGLVIWRQLRSRSVRLQQDREHQNTTCPFHKYSCTV